MANTKNLKPQNTRTKSEQREIARKGGIASGKARRERVALREMLEEMLGFDYTADNGEKYTYLEAIAARMLSKAATGDVRAAEFVFDRIEGKPTSNVNISQEKDCLTCQQHGIFETLQCIKEHREAK